MTARMHRRVCGIYWSIRFGFRLFIVLLLFYLPQSHSTDLTINLPPVFLASRHAGGRPSLFGIRQQQRRRPRQKKRFHNHRLCSLQVNSCDFISGEHTAGWFTELIEWEKMQRAGATRTMSFSYRSNVIRPWG